MRLLDIIELTAQWKQLKIETGDVLELDTGDRALPASLLVNLLLTTCEIKIIRRNVV